MSCVITVRAQMTAEARLWQSRVNTAGGGLQWNSLQIANNLARQLAVRSYYAKIKYLLPMLGTGIGAARVPLIDVFNAGTAINTAFVNGDFDQGSGLQGDGTSKSFNLAVTPAQLGNMVGGMGYWENNISFAGSDSVAMGCYQSNTLIRAQIDMRAGSSRMEWGLNSNAAVNASAPTNGHYYSQSVSNASRFLYFNAAQTATNTTSDASSVSSFPIISLLGTIANSAGNWAGRCGVAYLTDGTMTTDEISDFDTLLRAYLFGPTGRPTS